MPEETSAGPLANEFVQVRACVSHLVDARGVHFVEKKDCPGCISEDALARIKEHTHNMEAVRSAAQAWFSYIEDGTTLSRDEYRAQGIALWDNLRAALFVLDDREAGEPRD